MLVRESVCQTSLQVCRTTCGQHDGQKNRCQDVLGFPRLFDTFVVTTSAPRRGPPPLVEPRSVAEAEDLARETEETVVGCRSAVPVIRVSDEDARVKSGCE